MIYFSEHILTVRDRDCSVVEQKKRARTMIRFPGIFRVHAGVSPKSTSFLGRGKEFTRSNHKQHSCEWGRFLCKAASMLQKWYCDMESSSHGEKKTLDQIISELCKVDVLVLPNFMKDCQNILKEVRIPKAGWREETSCQLHKENSTYRYRFGVFETFVNTKAKNVTINDNKSEKEFCKTFREFLYEKENHCSNEDLKLSKVPSDDSKVEVRRQMHFVVFTSVLIDDFSYQHKRHSTHWNGSKFCRSKVVKLLSQFKPLTQLVWWTFNKLKSWPSNFSYTNTQYWGKSNDLWFLYSAWLPSLAKRK